MADNASKPARQRRVGPSGIFTGETIGPPECPIMRRWTLLKVRGRKLMLHRFFPDADDRAEHDHPAPFWTFVLRGGYDDRVECPECGGTGHGAILARCLNHCDEGSIAGDKMRAGMLRRREATYRHRTRVLPSGAWTIIWMGRKERP